MRTDFGGRRWIRTTEVSDNRFTVCPLWPLGNSPICKAYCLNSRLLLELVDGLEPPICWLQISCSTNWATPAFFAVSQEILFCFCISRWLLIYNTIRGSKCQHFFQTFLKSFFEISFKTFYKLYSVLSNFSVVFVLSSSDFVIISPLFTNCNPFFQFFSKNFK